MVRRSTRGMAEAKEEQLGMVECISNVGKKKLKTVLNYTAICPFRTNTLPRRHDEPLDTKHYCLHGVGYMDQDVKPLTSGTPQESAASSSPGGDNTSHTYSSSTARMSTPSNSLPPSRSPGSAVPPPQSQTTMPRQGR
jgi:hypothetical protein